MLHIISIILFIFISALNIHGAEFTLYEKYSDSQFINTWKINKNKQNIIVTGDTESAYITIIMNQHYHTLEWSLKTKNLDSHITAKRINNSIQIQGKLNETLIQKSIVIDSSPWVQAPGIQLNPFILSRKKHTKAWIVKRNTLTAYKMNYTKVNKEKNLEILMRPAGIAGIFWNASLWFDLSDGYLLGYKGPSEGVGSNKIYSQRLKSK